jgi:uncharacterized damage-inducible protein DinB
MIPTVQFNNIRVRYIGMMQKTLAIWQNLLSGVSQEDATTFRDGPDGWTTLEVLCHVRDYDGFFLSRAKMMVEQEHPQLPAYDHEALAKEHAYNDQNLQKVLAELAASRQAFVAFFEGLDDAQWQRSGVHPARGEFTMLDAALQVCTHDADHLEQVTRILAQRQ